MKTDSFAKIKKKGQVKTMILNETFTLSNGVKIPKIGLGTWQIPDGEDTYNSVMFALKNGYRHGKSVW